MTARSTWKASERRVASDLLGQRIPVTGVDRDGADVITPLFHVQVKLRKSLPQWLWDWLRGIVGDAAPHRKIGVLSRPESIAQPAVAAFARTGASLQ